MYDKKCECTRRICIFKKKGRKSNGKGFKAYGYCSMLSFLAAEGFIGGMAKKKDIWDELVTWSSK